MRGRAIWSIPRTRRDPERSSTRTRRSPGLTSACNGDQLAELDLVLPPGVSLAVDASHPIKCFYEDPDEQAVVDPACPTRTVAGVYGPQLPAGDEGGGWDLSPGRTYEVQFPLVSTRQLKGGLGGYCPRNADEIAFHPDRDCLITAVHVIDGDTNPWLTPSEDMYLAAPAPTSGGGGSTGGAGGSAGGGSSGGGSAGAAAQPETASFSLTPKTITATSKRKFTFVFGGTAGKSGKSVFTTKVKTKTVKLGSANYTVDAKGQATVAVTLSSANFKALQKAKKQTVAATVTLDGRSFATTFTLKPPKAKKN